MAGNSRASIYSHNPEGDSHTPPRPQQVAGQTPSGDDEGGAMKSALNEVTGDRWLCAWPVAPGAVWVQTRLPQLARKLSQRGDSRLVALGVAGGYLRTFEFKHGLAWARRLIARYTTANETATCMGLNPSIPPVSQPFSPIPAQIRVTVTKDAKPPNERINSPCCPDGIPEMAERCA